MPRKDAPRAELVGLLAACKDAPDDDAPRLILADWLEEHGEADRARFVRLQVARAARPREERDEDKYPEDEQLILDARGRAWAEPFGRWGVTHRRGLVALSVPADRVLSRAFGRLSRREAWAWV